MRRRLALALVLVAAMAACLPASAGAFGIHSFGVALEEAEGTAQQAGSHPFALTTTLGADFDETTLTPQGWLRDFVAHTPPGLVGDTTAYLRCTTAQFLEEAENPPHTPNCPRESQVGVAGVASKPTPESTTVAWEALPLFNVIPPPGVLVRLGFRVLTQNVFIDITLSQSPPYEAIAASRNTPQAIEVLGAKIQVWGNPGDPAHDKMRTPCGPKVGNSPPPAEVAAFRFADGKEACGVGTGSKPFLTLPTQCSEPLSTSFQALSWEGEIVSGGATIPALTGCGLLNFKPSIDAQPTNQAASSPSGLDFDLDIPDEGLTSPKPGATAQSAMRKAVVTLPKGMTVNPSQAEGLDTCSEADLARETVSSQPGEGCPQASKIGTLQVQSPLVSEAIDGALYVAEPHHNLAGDSLIAVYAVFKNPQLGIIIKQPLSVHPDPRTGQLVSVAEDVPQLPFSHFHLHFREGGRSPLITPPLCGTYQTEALLYPYSGNPPEEKSSSFQIYSGPGGGPCPQGATPPFVPGFEAGSTNNAAGRHSTFAMRLTRRDGDQDLTRFDVSLPPGVGAILAGVERCPDAQIALAKAKSGRAELASPSCPQGSLIGAVTAGAGAGSELTYVSGRVYLAGPFAGAPLSAVAIVPAVAGPFDVGDVVTRQALRVDPRTGEVSVDGSRSDPIPHILEGIPLAVRDIQVRVNRAGFTYNPTSCDPFATKASIWGGGADPFSSLDDSPVARQAPFQAASCQSLGFSPRLALRLRGGTSRGAHPALRGIFTPRRGDANLQKLVLRLPRSAFLEQAHIRTICTRVQFAAGGGNGGGCPQGSIYGHVRAFTPVLAEPLEGPVYLRSSNHELPDLVAALHGTVDIEAVARIDSVHGGIRATFTQVPDAPISKVVVNMQGAKKGLIVNSRNLCGTSGKNHASAELTAHNAKRVNSRPVVGARCAKQRHRRR